MSPEGDIIKEFQHTRPVNARITSKSSCIGYSGGCYKLVEVTAIEQSFAFLTWKGVFHKLEYHHLIAKSGLTGPFKQVGCPLNPEVFFQAAVFLYTQSG
jgi:hypothetical protein